MPTSSCISWWSRCQAFQTNRHKFPSALSITVWPEATVYSCINLFHILLILFFYISTSWTNLIALVIFQPTDIAPLHQFQSYFGSIHPVKHHLSLHILYRVTGSYASISGWRWGIPWTGSQFIAGPGSLSDVFKWFNTSLDLYMYWQSAQNESSTSIEPIHWIERALLDLYQQT